MKVTVVNGEISEKEKEAYVLHALSQYSADMLDELVITLDGEYVELDYHFRPVSFQRIRRITGYLVGTLDRFNDAKRAEVEDRVKHGIAYTT